MTCKDTVACRKNLGEQLASRQLWVRMAELKMKIF